MNELICTSNAVDSVDISKACAKFIGARMDLSACDTMKRNQHLCVSEVARLKNDISICDIVPSTQIGNCIIGVATHSKDFILCNGLKKNKRNMCYDSVAQVLAKRGVCNRINNPAGRKNCRQKIDFGI